MLSTLLLALATHTSNPQRMVIDLGQAPQATGAPGAPEQRPKPAKLVSLKLEGVTPITRVGRIFLGGQPSIEALEALIAKGVDRVVDLRTSKEQRGFDEPARVQALGARYIGLPFGGQTPLTDKLLDQLRGTLSPYRGEIRGNPREKGRLLLHCASANRVGAVFLAARVLDEGVTYETALKEARQVGLRSKKYEEYVRLYILGAGKHDLGEWKEKIRLQFPGVNGISVQGLAREMALKEASPEAEKAMLIDVREPAEFAVSHISGASNASSEKAAQELLRSVPKEREIVVYCSIGYRSATMARDLKRLGYRNVRNLEGSIFEWANTGHPVFRDGKRVDKVHPFDKTWGKLLRRDLWSDTDAE